MNNPSLSFRKIYTLKAQTPILHFQYNQAGVTLRATEVKPKLDSFICSYFSGKIKSDWYVKKDVSALKYKLHFEALGNQEIIDPPGDKRKKEYDIFYGNMGVDNNNKKQLVKGDVKMTVICVIPELLHFIDEVIAQFFAVTNFGTMQNKGFGSYIVEEKKSWYTPANISNALKYATGSRACYCYVPPYGDTVFKTIKVIYSMMKSGVNYANFMGPDAYQRSLLFLYMHTDEYQMGNEKAWMKQMGIAPIVNTNGKEWHGNSAEHTAFYVRALLGIGEQIEFKGNVGKVKVTIENTDKDVDNKKLIERFASPIFFKVIGGTVYIVAKRIDENIYGKTFKFSSKMGVGTLRVPTKSELPPDFIDEFLKYCVDNINRSGADKFRDTKGIKIREV